MGTAQLEHFLLYDFLDIFQFKINTKHSLLATTVCKMCIFLENNIFKIYNITIKQKLLINIDIIK